MSEVVPTPADVTSARFPGSYAAGPGFDEAVARDGALRPHYAPFLRELENRSPKELRRRSETARRLVHEQGITYHVYGDPAGMERPWRLDPVPLIVGADEWAMLESALIQRATLLNRILSDCYGPQDLLLRGVLPPALVFAQPDFIRACHGIRPAQDLHLTLYAADLARASDGSWWVASDRTQIPTGAGYALANRLVTSRVMPEAFRECGVQRLAGFFREIQRTLCQVGAGRTDEPRVVMLTPGAYNETYFEQAYLARYLGYTLVEGQDLTVRDRRVFLKTLSGLEPVDVILRRVDDDFCDPLELRADSILGVPGLVDAWRAGNVAIANALGSGLVQNPAFLPFLPGLCEQLLGEKLKLPSVATWWCGQKSALDHVLAHLDQLAVKPAFRTPGSSLGKAAFSRDELRRRITFQPHLYVAQESIALSTAPSWGSEGFVPRPVSVRVYLVASGGTYKMMAGGLARVTSDPAGRLISMQRGGASKDTWALSNGPVQTDTLLHAPGEVVELRRVGNNLPSRMADNFFWLGRYVERADAVSRLLRSTVARCSAELAGSASAAVQPMLATLAQMGQMDATFATACVVDADGMAAEIGAAVFDANRRGSLRQTSGHILRLSNLVRDRTSHDLWRVISQLHDRFERNPTGASIVSGDGVAFLSQVILRLASIHGLAVENMTRAQGWRFLDMGHRIERMVYLCGFLEAALRSSDADDPSVLEAVLEVVDNTITYRSRYNLLPHISAVYDLVLLDETNPRALIYQLQQLLAHIEQLPREQRSTLPTPAQRALLDAHAHLRLCDPTELGRCRTDWAGTNVAEAIRRVAAAAPAVSDAIAVSYFAHSAPGRSTRAAAPSA